MFPLLNTDKPNHLELFQIWLNLPRKSKFVEPHYAMLWKEQIPVVTVRDSNGRETSLEVIAGSFEGRQAPAPAPDSWAADRENEVAITYFHMESEAAWTLPAASEGINRTLYFFEGDQVLLNGTTLHSGNSVEVVSHQPIQLSNGKKVGRFLLLQGRPIQEPVVNYGPFVMNTEEEIRQTYRDYQESQFGGWPWERPDNVHQKDRGRFALHDDGREEFPGT
jgi:redox-sensitive bicupin YhaK (pirin superfamily)